jgi:hypothetical protein
MRVLVGQTLTQKPRIRSGIGLGAVEGSLSKQQGVMLEGGLSPPKCHVTFKITIKF